MSKTIMSNRYRGKGRTYLWMRLLAFFLGCTCCTDLIYIGKIGNTTITIGMAVAVVACFLHVLVFKRLLPECISVRGSIRNWLIVFVALILFSFAPALMYFGISSIIFRYVFGIVNLVGYLLIAVATIQYCCFERELFIGIIVGAVMNLSMCVIAYLQFIPNEAVPVYKALVSLFPQGSVQMRMWTFRAQGLYKESSYFIGYMVVVFWLLWGKIKETYKIIILFFLTSGVIAFSGSGNIIVYLVTILIMLIVTPKHCPSNGLRMNVSTFVVCALICGSVFFYMLFDGDISFVVAGLNNTLEGASIEQGAERYENITNALSMIPELPVGCGWNMINSYNMVYHAERLSERNAVYASGTSSFLLTLILEIGIVGAMAYVGFAVGLFRRLLMRAEKSFSTGIAGALVATILLQTVNGVAYFSHFMLVFGLAVAYACKTTSCTSVWCIQK